MWNYLLLIAVVSVNSILSQVTDNSTECICVMYYNCDDDTGTIITDGRGIIDGRAGFPKCEKSTEICCKPENQVTAQTRTIPTATSCGIRNPDGLTIKVFNENFPNLAEFGEFPWIIAILTSNGTYKCGGSLIHRSVVLTAAHCVTEQITYIARAGEWDSSRTEELKKHQDIKVSSIKIHEDYRPGIYYNDVALLFLESPFPLQPHINTICLPPANLTVSSGRCYAHGWGKQNFNNKTYATILKKIELSMVPKDECQEKLRKTRLGRFFQLHRSFVCAGGEEGKDVCVGDGGGPLVCQIDKDGEEQYQQIGIISWGIGCGDPDVPGVYADVPFLRQWIDKQISDNGFTI